VRSKASRDEINLCSYDDINEFGLQMSDNFEDTFDEIEDMLEGRKGWGDFFDDDVHTDGSEISDVDPCNTDQYHLEEIVSSETAKLELWMMKKLEQERVMVVHEI